MAGDWIKMRSDLHDDPAVVGISDALGLDEDTVVGKLHRLWCWADKHTSDGTAPAITHKWVDRYLGQPGFAQAMCEVFWLEFDDYGVIFPNFDRHNGQSAKARGGATLRQRRSRKSVTSVTDLSRDAVTDVTDVSRDVTRTPIPRPFVRYIMDRDGYRCVYCGYLSSPTHEGDKRLAVLSIDHILPQARGGASSVDNMCCCCRTCNQSKGDRTPEEAGIYPTFLPKGLAYDGVKLVTVLSQEKCDTSVTREEKRREEKSNRRNASHFYSSEFLKFWLRYPRKVEKAAASKAYLKAVATLTAQGRPPHETILSAATAYADHARTSGVDQQFLKYPASWLNAGCWDDDPSSWPTARTANGKPQAMTPEQIAAGIMAVVGTDDDPR